jgi:pimeloyl-ACP methyl ester carboxylesterase
MLFVYLLVVLLVVAAAAWTWVFYRHPLAAAAWSNRRKLTRLGLRKTSIDSEVGPQTYWVGGAGPTLVLLHGAGDQAGSWARLAAALVSRYRLVVPDLAGHSDSAPASGPLPIATVLMGTSAVVMRETEGGQAIIAGHSLGAWIATLFAAAHPNRVARLILINGGPIVGERADVNLMPKDRAEALRTLGELRDPSSRPIPLFVIDDIIRQAQNGPIGRLTAAALGAGPYLMNGRLHTMTRPVDLVWGESDRMMPLSYARRMLAALPAARLTTVARCGHAPLTERPLEFIGTIDQVLASLPPATSDHAVQAGRQDAR